MSELCQLVASTDLFWWQELIITTEFLHVRLDITSISDFQNAVCNLDFLNSELLRSDK